MADSNNNSYNKLYNKKHKTKHRSAKKANLVADNNNNLFTNKNIKRRCAKEQILLRTTIIKTKNITKNIKQNAGAQKKQILLRTTGKRMLPASMSGEKMLLLVKIILTCHFGCLFSSLNQLLFSLLIQ